MSSRITGLVALVAAFLSAASARSAVVTGEFVTAWQVCGPFDARGVLDPVIEGEGSLGPATHAEIQGQAWKQVKAPSGIVDFESAEALGRVNHVVAFAHAEIEAEKAGDVILGLGSDDSVMAWWNGRQVLVNDVLRGVNIGQDQVVLHMQAGRNALLLKVYDDGGGFGFAADLRPARDSSLTWQVVRPLSDDEFLDQLEQKTFRFFWDEANPRTGLVRDHSVENGPNTAPCSVASLGFGLTAICIGDARGWVGHAEALERVKRTLRVMLAEADHQNGFYYHFLDMETAKRTWESEASSIDTALFLAGALTCREYFEDDEIAELVNAIYARIDWQWMLNGGQTLSMGWFPETGFIEHRWDSFAEHMVLVLLAIGAPARAIPPDCWNRWDRRYFSYDGLSYVQGVPLFLHHYSHCWVDFRDTRDAFADYFRNSRLATRAHRAFCIAMAERFPSYRQDLWGVTASMAPAGYSVWGGPPPNMEYPLDGTIVPCAAGGSVAFEPGLTIPVLRNIDREYGRQVRGKYGLRDAFNPITGWVAKGFIGIDQGAMLLMIENHRSGRVWDWFMRAPEVQDAMRKAGFRTTKDLDPADKDYLRQLAKDTWDRIARFTDEASGLPHLSSRLEGRTSAAALGLYLTAVPAARSMGFADDVEADRRVAAVLDYLERVPRWNGFCASDLPFDPAAATGTIRVADSGLLAMGLVAAAQGVPDHTSRALALVDAMDWSRVFDAARGLLYRACEPGGGPVVSDGMLGQLGGLERCAVVMGIASGRLPTNAWSRLDRTRTTIVETPCLEPADKPYVQYLPGLFLDERDAITGRSAANAAYAAMIGADRRGEETWGLSSAAGGPVVPQQAALAIEDYPFETFANLVVLQRRGARTPRPEHQDVADHSMLVLALANYLENGSVRRWFLAHEPVASACASIPDLAHPEGGPNVSIHELDLRGSVPQPQVRRSLAVPRAGRAITVDGRLDEWPADGQGRGSIRFPEQAETGIPPVRGRFEAEFLLAWDERRLYIAITVREDELVTLSPAKELYKDDAVELFLDPAADGFVWGDTNDFQIGMSASGPEGKPQVFAWFQAVVPEGSEMASEIRPTPEGADYTIEAAIPWVFLKVADPVAGRVLGGTLAVHTVDRVRSGDAKINWSYVTDVDRVQLGTWTLAD